MTDLNSALTHAKASAEAFLAALAAAEEAQREGGRPNYNPLTIPGGILIGGVPGSGKSEAIRAWVADLPAETDVRVVDGKSAPSPNPAAVVGDVIKVMNKRLVDGALYPPLVLVIDEIAEFIANDKTADTLFNVFHRARHANITVALAAQNASTTTFPPTLRDAAAVAITFAQSTDWKVRAVLGWVPDDVIATVTNWYRVPTDCGRFAARTRGGEITFHDPVKRVPR